MPQEAIVCYQRALQSRPDNAMAFGKWFIWKSIVVKVTYYWCFVKGLGLVFLGWYYMHIVKYYMHEAVIEIFFILYK